MPEAIQVGGVEYLYNVSLRDWYTRVEFKFKRQGQEDFHVLSSRTGDHRNDDKFVENVRMRATKIFEKQGMSL